MPASEERMMILRMVEEGKVTPEEGARLLAALGAGEAAAPGNGDAPGFAEADPAGAAQAGDAAQSAPWGGVGGSFDSAGFGNRVFHVRVTNSMTGKQKVNVNIPLGLVDFGLRYVPPSAKFNVQAIRDAIQNGARGKIVDVMDEEKGDRVEVFIE